MPIEGRYYSLGSGGRIRSFIVLKPSPTWYRKRLDILIIVVKIDTVLRGTLLDIPANSALWKVTYNNSTRLCYFPKYHHSRGRFLLFTQGIMTLQSMVGGVPTLQPKRWPL